jgi:hypothetical protein
VEKGADRGGKVSGAVDVSSSRSILTVIATKPAKFNFVSDSQTAILGFKVGGLGDTVQIAIDTLSNAMLTVTVFVAPAESRVAESSGAGTPKFLLGDWQ